MSNFAAFFGLDFVATVTQTVALAARNFGAREASIIFGWAFSNHQFDTAVATFGSEIARGMSLTYLPALLLAGLVRVLAAGMLLLAWPSSPLTPVSNGPL